MKIYAAALLAIAAAATKIRQDDADMGPPPQPKDGGKDGGSDDMGPPPPMCGPAPTDDEIAAAKANPELVFDEIDQDGNGEIDEGEALDALYCAFEWGLIDEKDFDFEKAEKDFEDAAGDDGKLSKKEAKKAFEEMSSSSGEDGELAQEDGEGSGSGSDGSDGSDGSGKDGAGSGKDSDKKPRKDQELAQEDGSGSGSESGSDSGSEEKPLKQRRKKGGDDGAGKDSDSDRMPPKDGSGEDEELAQKPGKGSGRDSDSGSDGPDLDSEDLEALEKELEKELKLAQEGDDAAKKPKKQCPKKPTKAEVDAAEPEDVFDQIDTDNSGDIDEKEGEFALGCLVEWQMLTPEEAEAVGDYLKKAAGADKKLSKAEAKAAVEQLEDSE